MPGIDTKPASRVLVNSLPKSGTHLLSRVVSLLGYAEFAASRSPRQRLQASLGLAPPPVLAHGQVARQWQRHARRWASPEPPVPVGVTSPIPVPARLLVRWLKAVPIGHHLVGHLPWSAGAEAILQDQGYNHIVIVRDPRDVVVSFLHFIRRPSHPWYGSYQPLSEEEQLLLALNGGPVRRGSGTMVGLKDAFLSIVNWQQSPAALIVRFEDLIGDSGGGTREVQQHTVGQICFHLGLTCAEELVARVSQQAFHTGSSTFRRGRIHAWQDELSRAQQQQVTKSLADLLGILGYSPLAGHPPDSCP